MTESAPFSFESFQPEPSAPRLWWARFREKARYGLVSYYLQGRLADRGLKLCPFALYREVCAPAPVDLPPGVAVHRLRPGDATTLASLVGALAIDPEVLERRLSDGELGFALARDGEPVAMLWTSLRRCSNEMLPGDLGPNEAYSYGLYTARGHRGRGYATLLKRFVLAELGRMGRRWCLSIVDRLNRPSLRCKAKLDASVGGYFLYVRWSRGRRTYALPFGAERWF